jgi:hypothetical protein
MSDDYDPNSLNAVLARMEQRQISDGTKLDHLCGWTREHEKKDTTAFESMTSRLATLENFRWYLAGGIAVLVVAVQVVLKVVVK